MSKRRALLLVPIALVALIVLSLAGRAGLLE
jgi:hypothetical protein